MLLNAQNISKSYYSDKGVLICRALENVSLIINENSSLTITGPSGSGKSTFLNILGCIDYPDSGYVYYNDKMLSKMSEKKQAEFRNTHAGFIFQDHHLVRHCSVIENILLPCLANKRKTGIEEKERAEHILEKLGIIDKKDYLPAMLSGGERQRTAFARSLINSPRFILADEPTGNLDRKNSEQAMKMLLDIAETEKISLIIVTHSSLVASMFKTEYALANGRLKRSRG
jgi:lipoprotein-releasing system ATP-binding protein